MQILAEKTEQNVLVSDAVSGRLSVNLQEVSWRQAMDLILLAHNLAEQRIGEAPLIAPAEQIAAAQHSQLQHLKDLQQVKPLRTALPQVLYAQAAALAELMAGKGNRFLTKRGGVSVDERTNTLVVTDVPERLAWVRQTLEQIDVPLRQVQIEAHTPLVSSLPIIGRIFRQRIVRDDQQELLVFVTPVIIQPSDTQQFTAKVATGAQFDRVLQAQP